MHAILDEIILGGQVLETSSSEVVKAVEEIYKYSPNPLCFFSLLFIDIGQDAISYICSGWKELQIQSWPFHQ